MEVAMTARWSFLLLLLPLSCGDLAAEDYAAPYASFRGSITAGPGAQGGLLHPRVAFVWRRVDSSGRVLELTQDAGDVHAVFPVGFRLDLTMLPPKDALTDAGDFSYALGRFVVYDDRDDSRTLDLDAACGRVGAASHDPGDRIAGAEAGVAVIYVEGPAPRPDEWHDLALQSGFNRVRAPDGGMSPCSGARAGAYALLPLDAEIAIELGAGVSLDSLCKPVDIAGPAAISCD
jgi:hypothetical protein